MLEQFRDYLKAAVAAHQAEIDRHSAMLAQVEAELARVPTLEDVRALVARVQ